MSGALVVLEVEGFPLRRQWHVVHLRRRRLATAVRAFIEFLRGREWLETAPRPGRQPPTD